jgi:hypothetical protein
MQPMHPVQPLCFGTGSKRVATGGKWSVWGNYNRWGVLQSLLPHTMEKHQRSGLRWTTGIIPHLVQECQPQHSALW